MKLLGAALALLMSSGVAMAQDTSPRAAIELGSVLGSEESCGLTYDQDAIQNYIAKNVAANDMMFVSTLENEVGYFKRRTEEMSPSTLLAHCTQIRRVVKQYGFTK